MNPTCTAAEPTRRLTIGIDARAAVDEGAGRGQVLRELVAALARRDDDLRYVLYLREPWDVELDERFRREVIAAGDPVWHVRTARAANRACDVFLSSNSYLTAWFLRRPCAVVVYDMVAFMPETHPQRRSSLIERATIRPAIRRADRLLAISQATADDLVGRFPAAAPKTVVTAIAAGDRFREPRSAAAVAEVAERFGLAGGYVLSAATLEPRKNLVRLIEAWAALAPEVRGARRLALAGRHGWELDRILEAAGQQDGVALLGYVSDDDLVALYQGADAVCYPSLYEGFGLPVHEGICAGVPVITSDRPSTREVAGDAALLVEPTDVGSIAGALERVLTDPALAEDLRRRAALRAPAFTWQTTAEAVLRELRAIAG